jgi:hypothetical protein
LRSALQAAVRSAPESDGATNPEALLPQILATLHQWEVSRTASAKGEPVKRRVAAEIEAYLGRQATERVLEPVPESGENMLSTIEPVLALFLGNRTASRLVSHVVTESIVRI